MAYKVIPQVEFDKSVQRILSLGISRTPAENIVLAFWKISQDMNFDFKTFLDRSTAKGKLEVEQLVLDRLNLTLPDTIKYYKDTVNSVSPIVHREL
ncbi:hypothetical protein UFOVP71_42 [uncultured Caudovirales phage]|uniref:Uncharacterized protein n=1 Tax=uncultured Caudovirales phage TaxID=2100421 RepID=A0A6J5TB65_9CAUD|nr:hypothetical protein UFOVP71_42 [uncultured Caudovirales phage]